MYTGIEVQLNPFLFCLKLDEETEFTVCNQRLTDSRHGQQFPKAP
jgi:hypothetical protein